MAVDPDESALEAASLQSDDPIALARTQQAAAWGFWALVAFTLALFLYLGWLT
jgi:hypothetical protein